MLLVIYSLRGGQTQTHTHIRIRMKVFQVNKYAPAAVPGLKISKKSIKPMGMKFTINFKDSPMIYTRKYMCITMISRMIAFLNLCHTQTHRHKHITYIYKDQDYDLD